MASVGMWDLIENKASLADKWMHVIYIKTDSNIWTV